MASATLPGRRDECAVLDGILDAVRDGRGGVLVLRGAAGMGKTTLLDRVAGYATDLHVVRVAAVEAERRLDFAVLHQLCAPVLGRLRYLPGPQHDALATAFGMRAGAVPDPLLVGLAVLGLLAEAGRRRPLVCTVDDAHWLDPASARALAFAARRLAAVPVALLFAARGPGDGLTGLPELAVDGLRDADARALLDSSLRWPLDDQVRERFLAEARGNPMALRDPPGRYAGGYEIPDGTGDPPHGLPDPTRRLVQLAAADPLGDPALVWRAARRLGVPAGAAVPAVEAGLVEFGTRVRFRDPRVRAAAYRSAPLRYRQDAHRALAGATDPHLDPDRRAWHQAQAVPGPDAEVADELERYADRARVRAGAAAYAAFLERAAALTPVPERRTDRALAAAAALVESGSLDAATRLVSVATAGAMTDPRRARVDVVRGRLAYTAGRYRDAVPPLLDAARRLAPVDAGAARSAYLEAWCAATFAGRLAAPGADAGTVAAAAGTDLLDLPGGSTTDELIWLWSAVTAAAYLWDATAWDALSRRYLALARDTGALGRLPLALTARAYRELFAGELDAAGALVEELPAVYHAIGAEPAPYAALGLAALRGYADETAALSAVVGRAAVVRGDGLGSTAAHWAEALLYNGSGRYGEALGAAEQGALDPTGSGPAAWSAVELVEAAARCGETGRATVALQRISVLARASGTDGALGVEARCRAVLAPDAAAEDGYREAVERLAGTPLRVDLARAHLLYGEWLRRANRRLDARGQLRTGYDMLAGMGVEAFAERARRELLATGETVRKRTAPTVTELTAQEAQIARLAREGLSNPEISSRLYISPRTVEWHLHKVFSKLDIRSRRQLRTLSM